jgi:hypothetical protein
MGSLSVGQCTVILDRYALYEHPAQTTAVVHEMVKPSELPTFLSPRAADGPGCHGGGARAASGRAVCLLSWRSQRGRQRGRGLPAVDGEGYAP